MTLGSLFDGAGTFPFAGSIFGIVPKWASEIEEFPIEVTKNRLPKMKHLGDITKISGSEIEPVDVITFGSPCQDLSVAGKQVGLSGERSGLFMEAIRIIKEMRRKTNGKYPRYAVWENVPGAFSSNNGEDFRTVLEELCKVKDDTAVIPRPTANKGKWRTAGIILADGYSLAWRVLDAQFWGVPQRRRRIFLVADFRGGSAGEILFKQEGLSRSFAESRETWRGITADTTYGSYIARRDNGQRVDGNGNIPPPQLIKEIKAVDTYNYAISEKTRTLLAGHYDKDGLPCVAINLLQDAVPNENVSPCVSTGNPKTGQANIGVVYAIDRAAFNQGQNAQYKIQVDENGIAHTLVAKGPGAVCVPIALSSKQQSLAVTENAANTLGANDYKEPQAMCVPIYCSSDETYFGIGENLTPTLKARDYKTPHFVSVPQEAKWIVRRVTPTECARLQGMPDWWCDGVKHFDSAEYKMWGNGMALPCVMYIMQNLSAYYRKNLLGGAYV